MTDDGKEPESEYDDLLREIARASERAPSPADSVLAPGSVVAGKFRIIRCLGAGGMGRVYEIEHELTRHRRALKILHPGASAEVVERFIREASAAARIGNPHVAETFDAGRLEGGEPYLLMELLEGETLEERLRRGGPIAPGELSTLIHQACEGIQAAHAAGIIHRDLKPENLFIETRGGSAFVKILDFGISKFDEGRTGARGLTRIDSVMGTPYYMSPEQVRGTSSVDARTDVYALGVVLYECACGVRPYDAQSVEGLAIFIHEGKATPLSERRPSLPPAFCQVVHRAMAVERDQRYRTAGDLAEALAPLCALAADVARVRASDPPRGVTRPSSGPPVSREVGGAPMVPMAPPVITATAMADTLSTEPPPDNRSRFRAAMLVAGSVAVMGVALLAMFAKHPTPLAATGGALTAGAPAPLPSAVASGPAGATASVAFPVASSGVGPDARDAGPLHAIGAPRSTGDVAKSGTPTSPASAAPRPASTVKSLANQTDLASENPFR